MALDFETIVSDDAFRNIEPERIETFRQLMKKLEGKSLNQSMEIIMSFSKTVKEGRPITNEEQKAMLAVIMNSLPENDKQKLESILRMMDMMK